MNKEKAYEILELENNASSEDIKKKYENFMRLTKFDKSYDEKLLTEAFDYLMGYSWGEIKNEQDYYKKGLNKKKIDNFFYHYGKHLIYGTLVFIIFGALFISMFHKQPKPDAGIMLVGNTRVINQEAIEDKMEKELGFEFIRVIPVFMSQTSDGEVNTANMNLLATTLQGGDGDLIFTDYKTLDFLASEDAVKDLSLIFEELGIDKEDERIIWLDNDVYGTRIAAAVNLGEFSDFDAYLSGNSLTYLSIPIYTRNTENAYTIFKAYINK